jgi:hypothetical protein
VVVWLSAISDSACQMLRGAADRSAWPVPALRFFLFATGNHTAARNGTKDRKLPAGSPFRGRHDEQ